MNIGLLHPRVGRSTFPSDSSLPLHSILGEPGNDGASLYTFKIP